MGKTRTIGTRTAVLAMALLACAAAADPREDANQAYEKGDYAAALGLWRPLAERGDADAAYRLGALFYRGEGTSRDYREALKWFGLAAEQGHAGARSSLGSMYYEGTGVARNTGESFRWFRLAAGQGVAMAQYMVSIMYFNGTGIAKDLVEAYMWGTLAAVSFERKEDRESAAKTCQILARSMSAAQVAEAKKRALAWKPAP
jgi:uncharacterized protein